MEAGDWVLADVQAVVGQALALEGAVLSAGETVLARRVLALTGAPGRLWARLVGRRPRVFRPSRLAYPDVPDLPVALAELRALDLVHVAVPEAAQLACYTVPELKEACGRLGLRRGGRRDQLEARLTEAGGWAAEPVIRVAGHGLLRRLEGLCFQDRWQDRSVLLLERLGVSRWADYPLTSRARAFRRRADFLRWAAPLPEATPEARLGRLRTLAARPRWQRRLCPRRREERHLVDALRELERRGEPGRAAALYRALLEAGATHPGAVAARLAQALDAQGEPGRALAAARRWRPLADPVERLALDRVGRRLSRKTRGAWAPEPPLRRPPERTLRLPASRDPRGQPRWGDPPDRVEAAVARVVPRTVLSAENLLWTTLFGLLLRDLVWLPVAGMLPRRHLSGPLDLGTPAFAQHRAEPLAERLAALQAGEGTRLLDEAWAHRGERLRGVAWDAWSREDLVRCLEGVGGPALAEILGRLAAEGWAAAVGLPDLVVLPGPATRLPESYPSRLDEGLVLVEVKGPTDTVRDAQAVWFDRLLAAGAPVAVWRVAPLPGG